MPIHGMDTDFYEHLTWQMMAYRSFYNYTKKYSITPWSYFKQNAIYIATFV